MGKSLPPLSLCYPSPFPFTSEIIFYFSPPRKDGGRPLPPPRVRAHRGRLHRSARWHWSVRIRPPGCSATAGRSITKIVVCRTRYRPISPLMTQDHPRTKAAAAAPPGEVDVGGGWFESTDPSSGRK